MSKQSHIPSADLLLKQYIRLAQQFTDAATPQDNFLATIASDWRYERALQGIRLLAQHHLGHLVQSLIAWRQNVNDDIKKNYSTNNVVNVQGVCKRAAMEILFLEAAHQVLDEFVPEFWRERHFQTFFESMQHVAFRWLLNAEEYVPHQELSLVRQHVVLVSSRIVGALSRIKLSDICNTFVKKLEERVNVRKDGGARTDQNLLRSQALKLCAGMRSVVLRFDNDSQLEQSTRFVQKANPLLYTAAVKKSQVHHVLCEMLTDILTPLVRTNQPYGCSGLSRTLLAEWSTTVLRLKNEIGQWANKHNKHIMVGYPLVTVLVCLVDAQNYNALVDSMADFLAKQMKNKEYRSLCFKCLNQLIISSLVRNATPSCSPQVVAWLDKIVKPGLINARKGGISVQEQQDFVADMADLNPEYCVGSIIPDLLQSDSADAQLIALRTLYLVATSVPRDSAAALDVQASISRRNMGLSASLSSNSSTKRMMQLPTVQVLDLIRKGEHPFELQGISHLLPRVQQQLGQLLANYHRSYGSYLSFSSDGVPKDKQAAIGLFSWVVRLVPLLQPEQWVKVRPLDLLPSYIAHVEGSIRQSSFDALVCTVRACPALRGTVLSNMATFLGLIPDEATQTIQECLLLLQKLIEAWLALLQQQRLASSGLNPQSSISCGLEQQQQQPLTAGKGDQEQLLTRSSKDAIMSSLVASSSGQGGVASGSFALDVHRLEGVLFTLLCSSEESIRCGAYGVLGFSRLLHQELQAVARQVGAWAKSTAQQRSQAADPAATGATRVTGFELPAGAVTSAPSAQESSVAAAGGAGIIHKPTVSRDSLLDLAQTIGSLETPEAGMTYIVDVLEEAGDDAARRCFWDFGDWSDLWRDTKHVPLDVSLQSVMAATDEVGSLRWMRCIVELARTACHMCPASMGVAYMEVLNKLTRYLTRDSAGRLLIPTDAVEGRRSDAWKAFAVVACVCPPLLWDQIDKAEARKDAAITARELVRSLLSSLTGGSGFPQQVCLMALGHASTEHYQVMFEELPVLMDEYQRPAKQKRGTARPEEARKMVANLMRLVADSMAPDTLSAHPLIRSRFLDWLRDTMMYLRSLAPFGEAFWEVSQVAYCLCAVCRCIAGQLAGPLTLPLAMLREATSAVQRASSNKSTASEASTAVSAAAGGEISQHGAGQPMARKLLFDMFAAWCEEGTSRGGADYQARLNAGINSAIARIKDYDTDTREALRQELVQSAELLDQAARLAMAAMLQGPAFDTDTRRIQGPVLSWIDRLLQAPTLGISAGRVPAVPKESVGRTALFNLLRNNLDMFAVCVDRCYDRDQRIATGSFQVVSEVYALNPVKVEAHVVLSLVLYKMVDSSPEIREDALHMLHVLSTREWQVSAADMAAAAAAGVAGAAGAWKGQEQQREETFALEAEGGSGTVVVLGALQDSYQQFQYQLAAKLARDHPELSEALCEEMMTRQLELADKVSQHPVLTCLGPWMENLTIAAHWKGTWCERLLKSMYYVTLRHGDELPLEIERLWSTLAANRRNIIPILDFLASLGTHIAYQELSSMLEYLGVSKRICLYLARISPQQTIDHLVYEISLQLHEEEGVPGGAAAQLLQSGQQGPPPVQFADMLVYDTPATAYQRLRPVGLPAAAETSALLRSSASSWWAYSSTSSLASTAAAASGQGANSSSAFPSNTPTGNSYPGAGGNGIGGAATGLLGLTGGSSILAGIGLGASFPPGPTASSFMTSQTSPMSSVETAVATSRGMRLTNTFTSVFGMGSSAASAPVSTVPGAGTGAPIGSFTDMRDTSITGLSTSTDAAGLGSITGQTGAVGMYRSITEESDSTRSSLSITGQGSSTTAGADMGSSSGNAVFAGLNASTGSLAAAVAAGSVAPATAPMAPAGAPASVRGGPVGASFDLNSYYASNAAPNAREQGSGVISDYGASWRAGAQTMKSRRPSRQATREPSSPALRGIVTRPELALCLLTEVAYEHDEDFSSHLSLLCHVSLLLVDHEEQLVATAAQQLLVNCLYSLSARHLEIMQEEGHQVDCLQATHLIKYLQSMKGRRLWSYEDLVLGQQQQLPSAIALASLVNHCLDALAFETGLQDAWCGVALEWALHAHNRHLACRSQQVLRALKPPLTANMCSTLLACLQQCLAAAESSAVAREVALELLLTLRGLLEVLPARKLLLYPQVFWSSLMLLFTPYIHIYQQALYLLSTCLQQLSIHDSTTQNVLLASAPAASPADLQLLLTRMQCSSDWANTNKSNSKAAPDPEATIDSSGNWAETTQSRYGRTNVRSAVGAGASVASSTQSFVGGVDSSSCKPMLWPVGQLLPWPEHGADGPGQQMIAVQQVLFKGLLFQNTQLPTVQLLTLLARNLCQLQSPSSFVPVQAPLDFDSVRGVVWGSRDQGLGPQHRPITPGSWSSSRTASRGTGTPSRSSSRGSPANAHVTQAGVRPHSARVGTASLQQEQLLAQAAGGQLQPVLRTQQIDAADATSVSRSAPELRGIGGPVHGHSLSSGGVNGSASVAEGSASKQHQHHAADAAAGGSAGLSSSWGVWSALLTDVAATGTDKKLPGSRAVSQTLLGHRHAQLLVSIAAVVPFFCSYLGQLEPESELFEALQECILTLSAACSTQGLGELGSKLEQFTTHLNVNAVVTSTQSEQQLQQHTSQKQESQLKRSHQNVQLSTTGSSKIPGASANARHAVLLHLLQGLCLQLSRALLPTYADWLLRFWMGVLLLPGAAALHPHLLLLLRCLFDTPGLQLGHGTALLLDTAFLSPVVNLSQGPLCQYALDALDAIIHYSASSPELQALQQQQQGGVAAGPLSSSMAAAASVSLPQLAASGSAAAGGASASVDLQSLAACLLPQLDVVGLLQRVMTSCAAQPKRRKYKLLPFLGDLLLIGQQQQDQE